MIYLNWSGGKDSAMALHQVQQADPGAVQLLLTTVNETYQRISMHGVRKELLEQQARAIGLPVVQVQIPEQVDMESYDLLMRKALEKQIDSGFTQSVFGDIFLEDLRAYREERLAELGLEALFPLWKRDTTELFHEFVQLGFKAVVVCVHAGKLDQSFVGRELDLSFLNDLPAGVDPCGEHGEYHTFVYDGPIFSAPITFKKGEIVNRTYGKEGDAWNAGFWFLDLEPVRTS